MKKQVSDPVTIQHQFDSFVKKVLTGEVKSYRAEMARQSAKEALFSELSERELNQLCSFDKYDEGSEVFLVLGQVIPVKNFEIAEALKHLTETKRDVILLSFFLDIKDIEIANLLNLHYSTIHYHRDSSLRLLKELLEGKAYGTEKTQAD